MIKELKNLKQDAEIGFINFDKEQGLEEVMNIGRIVLISDYKDIQEKNIEYGIDT